ncbi:MAG TPA: hypothetical protein PLD47_06590, partial [Aggregatilineales bacterium]|nr:hypothetical protein [Aggregatilineales bacterium]
MTNSFRRAFPIAVLLVLCVPFLSLTSPVRAQGGPSETILDAIFNDLSSRIGKSVSWRRMDGQYLWEEVAVSNDNLGCTVGAGAAPGVTRAWKVDITLRDVGSYEYRTTLNGGVILYCTGTGLGATTGGADPTAPPPVIPVAGGKVAVEALGTTTTTTYNIPVLAYVGDSGNVRVLQAAPNVPATNVTGDANGGRDAASPYWTADAYYDNLTWSPDGSRFAFTKRTENSQELYVATSGSAPLRVATGIMTEIGVAWSLDGTSVLYPVFTGQPSATNPNDVLIQVQGVLATGGQPFVAGSFAFGVGCGGGGYSAAYQRAMMDTGYEGSQKRLVYTGQGILHTTNCTGRGMALTGFDGTVRWTLPNYGRFALSPDGLKIAAVQFAADGSPTSTGLA